MDWQRGKLPWYVPPPEMASRADKIKKPLALTIDGAVEVKDESVVPAATAVSEEKKEADEEPPKEAAGPSAKDGPQKPEPQKPEVRQLGRGKGESSLTLVLNS